MALTRDNKGKFTGGSYWSGRKGDPRLKGKNHWNWHGDNVGYSTLHKWARKQFDGPDFCWLCGRDNCRIDMACINKVYTKSGATWAKLCVRCHRMLDGHPFSGIHVPDRQRKIAALLKAGKTTAQMVMLLGVSKRTILRDRKALQGFTEVTEK